MAILLSAWAFEKNGTNANKQNTYMDDFKLHLTFK